MKTRSNIMRCAMAAHSLTQSDGDDNTQTEKPAEAYYGHGCCGYSRAYTGHHGCHTAPPRHNRRGYHCDGRHVCYHGYGIKDADPKTFTDLGGGYAKDSRRAYYAGRAIAGADAKTFKHIGRGVAKDKRNTYIDGRKTD